METADLNNNRGKEKKAITIWSSVWKRKSLIIAEKKQKTLETKDFNNKSEKEIWSSVGNGRR